MPEYQARIQIFWRQNFSQSGSVRSRRAVGPLQSSFRLGSDQPSELAFRLGSLIIRSCSSLGPAKPGFRPVPTSEVELRSCVDDPTEASIHASSSPRLRACYPQHLPYHLGVLPSSVLASSEPSGVLAKHLPRPSEPSTTYGRATSALALASYGPSILRSSS